MEQPDVPPVSLAGLDRALLGEDRGLNLDDLVREAAVSEEFVREYWRALGFPVSDDEVGAFTQGDASAIHDLAAVAAQEGFDEATVTTLVRSVGHTMDRLALWQVEALVDHTVRAQHLDDAAARRVVLGRLSELAPALEAQLIHAWRRHAASLAGRYAVEFAEDRPGSSGELPLPRAVGFVDIVDFTKRTAGLGSADLASFVQEFESRARDVVAANGARVVKTIGDAVLFIADDVASGALVALELAEQGAATPHSPAAVAALTKAGHPELVSQPSAAPPPVRVSLVWGRVLSRFGDVFGPVVNLASRLSERAVPGTVLIDTMTAAELARDERFALTRQPSQDLQGFGPTATIRLGRAFRPEDA